MLLMLGEVVFLLPGAALLTQRACGMLVFHVFRVVVVVPGVGLLAESTLPASVGFSADGKGSTVTTSGCRRDASFPEMGLGGAGLLTAVFRGAIFLVFVGVKVGVEVGVISGGKGWAVEAGGVGVETRLVDTVVEDATDVGRTFAGANIVVIFSAVGLSPVKVVPVADVSLAVLLALPLALPQLRKRRCFEGMGSSSDS